MNPSVYSVSRFHLKVVSLGISSSSFRATRHRVQGWLKRATSSEVAKKTLLPNVNRLNRWSLVTSQGQLYKGYHSLLSRRRFFLRRRKKSRGRARGEKERLKKVNRPPVTQAKATTKKKQQQIKQTNRQQQQTRQNHCPLMRIDKPLGFHGLRKVIVTRHAAHEKAVGSRATPFA